MKRLSLYALSVIYAASLLISCQKKEESPIVQTTYIHPYGNKLSEQQWSERGGNGKIETLLKSGEKITQSYKNKQLNGVCTTTFPHSRIIEKKDTYENNVLKTQELFYLNGLPKQKVEWLTDSSNKITSWYEEGSPKSIEFYQKDILQDGVYFTTQNQEESRVLKGNGTRTVRNALGILVHKEEIANGTLKQKTVFYSNGDPQSIIPYQNNLVHGTVQRFFLGGIPSSSEEWSQGKLNGYMTLFQNGEKTKEIFYRNGLKEGVSKRFRDGSVVVEETSWKNDQKHGPSYLYIGDNTKTEWYFRGSLVSKEYFDEASSPR